MQATIPVDQAFRWAMDGLASVVVILAAWSIKRELRRIDKDREDGDRAIRELLAVEIKHRDTTQIGNDGDMLHLRAKVHELENQGTEHRVILEKTTETIRAYVEATRELTAAVADLRGIVISLQTLVEERRINHHRGQG